jgi:CTP synthase (UTP-ammonia lyase)
MSRVITVLMDLPEQDASFRFTVDALEHAVAASSADVSVHITHTDAIATLGHGVVIGPGSPYRDAAAAEDVIRAAREKGIPLVGT